MKQCPWLTFLLITITLITITLAAFGQGTNLPPVAVPDEATAVKIAEKALIKIFGKRQIQKERPFSANLAAGIWHVTGTLYCKDEHGKVVIGACVGGVAMADIRQNDGRVVKTGHTR